jgi:hypothetical protein
LTPLSCFFFLFCTHFLQVCAIVTCDFGFWLSTTLLLVITWYSLLTTCNIISGGASFICVFGF